MRYIRVVWLILAVMLGLANCSTGDEATDAEEERPRGPCQTTSSAEGDDTEVSEHVNRPQPGEYVYDFCGLRNTPVPQRTRLTESVSAQGDVYTIDVSTNLNENTRRIQLRWEEGRVLQLSNETVIGGERKACSYRPPLEVLHIPIRVEDFSSQRISGTCQETVKVGVVGRASIGDANGRKWSTWIIEYRREFGQTERERHWFSPELGRVVRLETTSGGGEAASHTAQLLRRYPGSS